MRLGGYVVCIAGAVACAQGIQSPDAQGLDAQGGGGSLAAAGTTGISGGLSSSGAPAHGGALGGAGTSSAGNGGGSTATGGAASGGKGGSSGAAAAGASATGGGTGMPGCSHPQPGGEGMTLKYMVKAKENSVPYVHFAVEINNPDDQAIALADLHLRYYFKNDLTTPATDFYSPQIRTSNGTTHGVDGSLTATYMPTYLEVNFTSSSSLMTKETLLFEVHMHSDPSPGMHDQSMDYSFSAATTSLTAWCKIALYQSSALAWGTPPP